MGTIGTNGSNSAFGTLTALGGGYGAGTGFNGGTGGSGGGSGFEDRNGGAGQGNAGGRSDSGAAPRAIQELGGMQERAAMDSDTRSAAFQRIMQAAVAELASAVMVRIEPEVLVVVGMPRRLWPEMGLLTPVVAAAHTKVLPVPGEVAS